MRYYGITIGPIDATLALVSKPAGLWYASYMFSDITRMLCAYFSAEEKISILSPYYEENEIADGIGSYHDRVLFSFDTADKEGADRFVQETIHKVKTEVGNRLARDLGYGGDEDKAGKIAGYMCRYLCIHYISVSDAEKGEKGVGEILSPYLDTLELYKSIPKSGEQNYLLTLLSGIEESSEGTREDSNRNIKNSELIKGILDAGGQNLQLFVEGEKRIKNLAHISGAGKIKKIRGEEMPDTNGWKKWKYYAVVQADGDNLGKANRMLGDDLKIAKTCKRYTQRCAELIGENGGVTIFAGGDDLLFLAPLQNRKGKTILSLCSEISEIYEKEFQEINQQLPIHTKTTLSIGIAVSYWKFPLYEALEYARKQLFTYAKETKNTLAVTLQKAGGSKIEWKYPFGTEKEKIFLEFMDDILKVENQAQKDTKDGEKNNETGSTILHSVLYHLKEYEVLLKNAIKCGEKGTGICLDNMFEEHKSHAFFKGSRKMILDLIENYRDVDNVYEDIISILRLIHFFAEREE